MDFSLFLTIVVVAICFVFLRKLRFDPENQDIDQENKDINQEKQVIVQENLVSSSLAVSTVNPPTSSSHNWVHVFPSFRGEDVRRDFLSHIQKEFGRKGITPFIDNNIKRGESIGPELKRAIRGSKIAIILLSKNYASSKWCLDELVEIMKCREEVKQTVMVIFYKVDPSHVKKLAGDFGKVFKRTCAGQSKEDIEGWRQALVKVATIAGYDSRSWNNEATMIEKIATDVSNELIRYAPSRDFDGLVGMRAHMEKMNLLLSLDSNEVKMIGIWGPSGIGKSTIARVLYNQYSHQFNLSVFMDNIKRRFQNIHGYDEYSTKLLLQKEFLSQILNQEDIKIHNLEVVQDRLKHKKVLVVLDDVDRSMQLAAMAKEITWFGPGSRIIVTTQDKKVLKAHGIDHVYEVDFPLADEALQMLCTYAFDQKFPYEGFEDLAREVTKLAGKLPLGLRVLGSYFKGMLKHEWEKALPRLRISLDGEISSTLKFSYDALQAEDRDLFLYIACFFNNNKVEKVEAYLADDFSVSQGLQILAEKSLISVDEFGYIKMHDMLRILGKKIIRDQPRQRQFLVRGIDNRQVLNNDTVSYGTVIGTKITFFETENEANIIETALEKMSSLQFLIIFDGHFGDSYFPQKLNNLPREVRLLDWSYFPMACLPSNFNPESLVELNMPNSKLETLWEGIKTIRNLMWIDLSCSDSLRELPDLSTVTNLRKLDLHFCSNLRELPSSIGKATNLKELNLSDCSKLVELPSSIGNAINLEELYLSGCSSLVELPSSIGGATNLRILLLNDCSNLRELPSSIGNATKLEFLDLRGCSNLVKLPSSIENAINLQQLQLRSIVDDGLGHRGCSSLEVRPLMDLRGCSSLVDLPSYIGTANLKVLKLSGCSSLLKIPSSIGNAINLENIDLSGCTNLVELPSSIGNAINLGRIDLSGCTNLVELPSTIGNIIKLMELYLCGCSSLVELPYSIGNLHSLSKLRLQGCSKLKVIPTSSNMVSLEELNLTNCPLLKNFHEISFIRHLKLCGTAIEEEVPSSLRSWFGRDGLYVLHLSDTRIQEIPPWIKELSGLRKLVIKGCTKLVSLPGLPESLRIFDAENCESLERLDCSFPNTTFVRLNFANCFKLNQEARDLIIKATSSSFALLPGETVPTHFTYRANGSSVSMKLNGIGMPTTTSVRFKACGLLVYKGDVEDGDKKMLRVSHCIKEKENGVDDFWRSTRNVSLRSPLMKKHLFIFDFEKAVSSSELVFEVRVEDGKYEMEECGICTPTDCVPLLSRTLLAELSLITK